MRGSLWLMDRIKKLGFRKQGLGTLWSLYRQQNGIHRKIVELAAKSGKFSRWTSAPFETIIPNATAIAEAAEPGRGPVSFKAKYTTKIAALY